MIKKIAVKMKGISPLLMHAFPMIQLEMAEKKTPQEQAEHAAYRDKENGNHLYVPGVAVQRALVNAASYSKGKGRASLVKQAAACLLVSPERIDLKQKEYVIDSRRVVVPATRGAVIRHRPRLDKWEIAFEIEYDDTLLNEKEVRHIVDNMGSRVGLLDFRPEKKGPFGRCMVTVWSVI